MLKKSVWLLHIIGDNAPPAPRDSSEIVVHKADVIILTPETVGTVCL